MKPTYFRTVAGSCLAVIMILSLGMGANPGTAGAGSSPPGPPEDPPAPPHAAVWLSAEEKQALRNAFPPQERKFLVDVGPRLIHPRPYTQVAFRNGFANVYVQFWEALNADQRGQLKRMGVRFHGAISGQTYLAQIRPQAINGLRNHPMFRGIEPIEPLDKLTRPLGTRSIPSYAMKPDGRVMAYVRFFDNVRLTEALSVLEQLEIEVEDSRRMLFNNKLEIRATPEKVDALAESLLVRSINEIPAPPTIHNEDAAQISNVDLIQAAPFNLDGDGVVIGIWDGGPVWDDHPDLSPRVTLVETDNAESGHATHVAGTIISSGAGDSTARGMAPAGGELYSYDFNGNAATEQQDAVDDFSIVLSNHSWGNRCGWEPDIATDFGQACFGQYDATAADYDSLVRDTGLLVQKSSGNDSNNCTGTPPVCDGQMGADGQQYQSIGTFGNAKNIITVGALQDDGLTVTGFSSNGPSNDLRIKPDLIANGDQLWSTCSQTADSASYCFRGGTSMSTPAVSGAIALLVQRYRDNFEGFTPSPEIVKALLVNSAEDLGRPGPDYLYGHGLVDGLAAVETIDVGAVRIVTSAVDMGNQDEWLVEVPGDLEEFRVSLAWVDPEGPTNNDPVLINDLDVTLVAPDNTVNFPFSGPTGGAGNWASDATANGPNTVDNVEHARVGDPAQGIWRVRVDGTSVPDGPQNYALVSNASFLLADQPNIKVNAPLDYDEFCADEFQDTTVSIFNTGGADLRVNEISVIEGMDDFEVLGHPVQPFIVQPGAHVDLTVRFAPSQAGLRTGVLQILSNDADEGTLEIEMTGSGGEPVIAATLIEDFGDVCLEDSKIHELRITNPGTCPLRIGGVSSTSLEFVVAEVLSFPLVVSPGGEITVPIEFDPDPAGGFGPRSGTIQITHDGANPPNPRNLAVSGNVPPPNLVVDPADLKDTFSFPATVVDTEGTLGCYSDRNVVLRNNGACPLTIDGISATGADFAVTEPSQFPILLPPGEKTLGVNVRFTPQADDDPVSPGEIMGELIILSDDPDIEAGTAALCGESAAQSGVRILATDITTGIPLMLDPVERIDLQSRGINNPGPVKLTFNDAPLKSVQICGNDVAYHVNQETLPSTDTTGGGGKQSSYVASAKQGNLQISENFTLGQCEFRDFQLQVQSSGGDPGDPGSCPLLPKGAACSNDGECCSGKCRGPEGAMSCK